MQCKREVAETAGVERKRGQVPNFTSSWAYLVYHDLLPCQVRILWAQMNNPTPPRSAPLPASLPSLNLRLQPKYLLLYPIHLLLQSLLLAGIVRHHLCPPVDRLEVCEELGLELGQAELGVPGRKD